MSWLLLYTLAAGTGQFFYQEQLPLIRLIVTYLIYILIGILIYYLQRKAPNSLQPALQKKQLSTLRWAPWLYLGLLPLLWLIALLNQHIFQHILGTDMERQSITQQMTQWDNPLHQLYILTAILIAPLYEEILFRGILLPKLMQKTNLIHACWISATLFALLHFHAPALLPLFALSTALSIIYWWTGSLWNCIALHILFNTGSILLLLFSNA
jgi:membrane protease YdiL (CAAX protease family)